MATVLPSPPGGVAFQTGFTRLDLVNEVRRQCGIAGSPLTELAGAKGETLLVLRMVDIAWQDLQLARRWDWMWEEAQIALGTSQSSVPQTVAAARYLVDTAYIGASPLEFVDWRDWKALHPEVTSPGQPSQWTVRPDKRVAFNAVADQTYTMVVERYKNPTVMIADSDQPEGLPVEHHMAIVWMAVQIYAGFDESNPLYAHASRQLKRVLAAASLDETQALRFGGPLL